jgi:hypothetical protein
MFHTDKCGNACAKVRSTTDAPPQLAQALNEKAAQYRQGGTHQESWHREQRERQQKERAVENEGRDLVQPK